MLTTRQALMSAIWLIAGCATGTPPKPVDVSAALPPTITMSDAIISRSRIDFSITVTNRGPVPWCFDGTKEYPLGISLWEKKSLAGLDYDTPPLDRGEFGERVFEKFRIEPGARRLFAVSLQRPIVGIYMISFESRRYKKGDVLVPTSGKDFYDCNFASRVKAPDHAQKHVQSIAVRPFSEP